jgi:hypothetical protein
MGQQGYDRYGQDPRSRPAATPPQWGSAAPPRQEGTRPVERYPGEPQAQPVFRPAPYPAPQQPRGQYPPSQPAWQQPYAPPPQYAPGPAPRKKRRVFLWVFLAVQLLFIILIITQVAAHPAGPTTAQQAAQQCANGGWYPLFKSQADCQVHYGHALNDATDVGKGIGVALIVVFWVIVDTILGISYGVYRLATRSR